MHIDPDEKPTKKNEKANRRESNARSKGKSVSDLRSGVERPAFRDPARGCLVGWTGPSTPCELVFPKTPRRSSLRGFENFYENLSTGSCLISHTEIDMEIKSENRRYFQIDVNERDKCWGKKIEMTPVTFAVQEESKKPKAQQEKVNEGEKIERSMEK
ncbi:uncharacterized protein LOC112494872 [Cephus cinctus]|uniref:Uncharacterized protein LOC112494872 n=1 Tax=Cephus cinctus TaxID=211228 RepID=A0AAJ7RNH4_CEPCN|nr:uncharacterized protein LOC112494872 [Cephus cinctus]XP_024944182.1 uncharacterized protein LOC112494872 [Cephus cinctus]XP_024944183.1 uncharacterized protein LOC112494872 [Cephus cinctus]XP_024944184.1 uncharacterized protein LOC112494872 [Cephus cinctus]